MKCLFFVVQCIAFLVLVESGREPVKGENEERRDPSIKKKICKSSTATRSTSTQSPSDCDPEIYELDPHAFERMVERSVSAETIREIVEMARKDEDHIYSPDKKEVIQYGVVGKSGFFINTSNKGEFKFQYTPRKYQGIMLKLSNQRLTEFFTVGVAKTNVRMVTLAVYEKNEEEDSAPVFIKTVMEEKVTVTMLGNNKLSILRTNEETYQVPAPFYIVPADKRF